MSAVRKYVPPPVGTDRVGRARVAAGREGGERADRIPTAATSTLPACRICCRTPRHREEDCVACESARTTDGAARLAASMKLTIVFLMMLFSFSDAVRGV
jgi:hypothetical protein